MGMRDIIQFKNEKVREIQKQTEEKINKVLKKEFADFDEVIFDCRRGSDIICFENGDRSILFSISEYTFSNGSCVRKVPKSGLGTFTRKEIKEITERLNKLY